MRSEGDAVESYKGTRRGQPRWMRYAPVAAPGTWRLLDWCILIVLLASYTKQRRKGFQRVVRTVRQLSL